MQARSCKIVSSGLSWTVQASVICSGKKSLRPGFAWLCRLSMARMSKPRLALPSYLWRRLSMRSSKHARYIINHYHHCCALLAISNNCPVQGWENVHALTGGRWLTRSIVLLVDMSSDSGEPLTTTKQGLSCPACLAEFGEALKR